MSNSLDPDQAQHSVRPDLDLNCLQRSAADNKFCRWQAGLMFFIFSFQFKVNNEWWTWIDYPRFHQLVKDFKCSKGEKMFTSQDYMAKTPSWAVFGAKEQGFDPQETRFFRKSQKDIGGC